MSKTKAQLIEELKEVKALNEAHVENNAYLQKTNAEIGCRIGQLESDMAELEAFKQDALQAIDRQQKENELLKEKEKANLRCIEEMKKEEREVADEYHKCAEELNALKKDNEQLKSNILIDGERYFDLMTGPFIDIVRVRLYLKYGIGKDVR